MSTIDPHLTPQTPTPVPQDEALPVGKLVMVALVAFVAFALAVLWAVQIMVSERGGVPNVVASPAAAVGRAEIGMVDQTLFELEKRAVQMAADKQERLSSYGWVSKKEQLIHVPIQEAMKAVVAGQRPMKGIAGGTPQQGAAPADGGAPQQETTTPDGGTPPPQR